MSRIITLLAFQCSPTRWKQLDLHSWQDDASSATAAYHFSRDTYVNDNMCVTYNRWPWRKCVPLATCILIKPTYCHRDREQIRNAGNRLFIIANCVWLKACCIIYNALWRNLKSNNTIKRNKNFIFNVYQLKQTEKCRYSKSKISISK
jgi:hypothetical protein